jgi:hypothetical protein
MKSDDDSLPTVRATKLTDDAAVSKPSLEVRCVLCRQSIANFIEGVVRLTAKWKSGSRADRQRSRRPIFPR